MRLDLEHASVARLAALAVSAIRDLSQGG